jgi:hypothetical protein
LVKEYEEKLEKQRVIISEKDDEIGWQEEDLQRQADELQQQIDLISEKEDKIDELEEYTDTIKEPACLKHETIIRELEGIVDKLKEELYSLKDILNKVPKNYRKEYDSDDEWIPSEKSRIAKIKNSEALNQETEIDDWVKSTIPKLRIFYDEVYKWKNKYNCSQSSSVQSRCAKNFDVAHRNLDDFVKGLNNLGFFDQCRSRLNEYPDKFWLNYNGKLQW